MPPNLRILAPLMYTVVSPGVVAPNTHLLHPQWAQANLAYEADALRSPRNAARAGDAHVQRQGIGLAVMAAGMEWIVEHPWIRRIELEVHAQNEAAIRLYEHWGFVHEGKQIGRLYQHGQHVDTLRMARLMMGA